MTASDAMLKKFREGEFTVGVLGLGYVGLPLALVFAEKVRRTLGFDIKVARLLVDARIACRCPEKYYPA